MDAVTIPQIYCPFDFAVSPFIEALHESSMQWVCDMELASKSAEAYDRLASYSNESLAAYTQPFDGRDILQLSGDFHLWLFIYDDYVDKASREEYDSDKLAKLTAQLLAILEEQPSESTEPVARAFQDICERVAAQPNGEAWLKRFVSGMKSSLLASVWGISLSDADTVPDVSTYMKMRLHTSALAPCFSLMAISITTTEAAFLDHTYMKILTDMANHQISYVNDVFSLEKEVGERNHSNLAVALRNEFGLPWQEAVNRTIDMANKEVIGFLRLKNLLPSFGSEDEQARRYVTGLELWMRGHVEWGMQARRYEEF
jgi:5-epi-alpha-selinene synthase